VSTSGGYTALPSGSVPGSLFVVGTWYPTEWIAVGNTAFANGTVTAIPFYVGVSHTFSAIGLTTTVAATGPGIATFGVYSDNGSGYPSSLIVAAGSVSVASVGVCQVTTPIALTPGLYWLAVSLSGATAPATINRNAGYLSGVIGESGPGAIYSTGGWVLNGQPAALPATFVAGAYNTTTALVGVLA